MIPNQRGSDDRGVTPVIGVILMVAVTVVLSGVVGAFVFGFGDSTDEATPQAQFQIQYNLTQKAINITHVGGHIIRGELIEMRYGGVKPVDAGSDPAPDFGSRVTAGDEEGFLVDTWTSGTRVEVIWTSADGQMSAVLAESEVP